jgi:hypothetical protein
VFVLLWVLLCVHMDRTGALSHVAAPWRTTGADQWSSQCLRVEGRSDVARLDRQVNVHMCLQVHLWVDALKAPQLHHGRPQGLTSGPLNAFNRGQGGAKRLGPRGMSMCPCMWHL